MRINKFLKEHLQRFQLKIAGLIRKINEQFRLNNIFLEEAKSGEFKDSASFKASYLKCGAPFFKDALGNSAPYNEDYKYRKNVLKEFFPFDLPDNTAPWKTNEKVSLIKGVKNQMINYIKSQQSQKLCKDSRKTRGKLQKLKFIATNQDLVDAPILDIYATIQNSYPDFNINWNIISFIDLQNMHSVTECMGMWYSYLRPDLNREEFTSEENSTISNVFQDDRFNDWNEVAAQLDRRSALQCFVHFNRLYVRYYPNNIKWTEQEDQGNFGKNFAYGS